MRKILSILFLSSFLFVSCSDDGEVGPRGPEGPAGEDGLDGLGYTFEETVNFDYLEDINRFYVEIDISEDVETINPDADAVLVYRLEILEDENGGDLDGWSLIPQNFFLEEGTIQYVYNHTVGDVGIYIEGNYDLSNLDSGYTEGQTFRIVVVPSDTFASSEVDPENMEAVLKAFRLEPEK
ncbi:collagen-like triple helix repeat-containing protein [Autumnicola musiva]|uniref:Collagen-like protein n=1 Tax=Autumnicola musiva TaxID=3075589 RepID=A0ABU3DB48_9FLAO|nr:collagen-like protein [Zunongwangia sp. F117]MDT0678198.1 collagen-like protein [Zunongwangia sp. F117]